MNEFEEKSELPDFKMKLNNTGKHQQLVSESVAKMKYSKVQLKELILEYYSFVKMAKQLSQSEPQAEAEWNQLINEIQSVLDKLNQKLALIEGKK